MLPAILHRLNNATQILTSINALALLTKDPRVFAERAPDLAAAADMIDELGWSLGVLAAGAGTNLLFARRSRAGLAVFLAALRDALRRAGGELPEPSAPLPCADVHAREGWPPIWAVGAWLCAAYDGLAADERRAWGMRIDLGAWRVEVPRVQCAQLERTLEHIRSRVEEARGETGTGPTAALLLPAAWFAADLSSRESLS